MYIIKVLDAYYLRDARTKADELYDLEQATVFAEREEAKKFIKSIPIYSSPEFYKILPYKKELKNFLDWKKNGMVRRTLPKSNKKMSRPYNGETVDEVIEWRIYASENESEIHYKHYKTWPDLYTFLNCFSSLEHYKASDDTLVRTFRMTVSQGEEYKTFKKEFDKLLPYVTYKENEFFIFSIMDHELSRYETRYLYYSPEKSYIKGRRGWDELFSGTLKECFEEIKKRYYYETYKELKE